MILLGAEFNAELERGRAIEDGMRPEDKEPFVEPRDTRKMEELERELPTARSRVRAARAAPVVRPTRRSRRCSTRGWRSAWSPRGAPVTSCPSASTGATCCSPVWPPTS